MNFTLTFNTSDELAPRAGTARGDFPSISCSKELWDRAELTVTVPGVFAFCGRRRIRFARSYFPISSRYFRRNPNAMRSRRKSQKAIASS